MDKNFKAYNQTAETLKAIAHPVRLCIIKGLLEKGKLQRELHAGLSRSSTIYGVPAFTEA